MCGYLSCALYWGPGLQLGICPDWESNQWPLASQAGSQSTEPHQLGLDRQILTDRRYWVSQRVHLVFFCKMKGTFFIFTNKLHWFGYFEYVDWLSCYWLLESRSRGAAKHLPVCKAAPDWRIFGQNVSCIKKLHKPLLTLSITYNTFSIHYTKFLCVL